MTYIRMLAVAKKTLILFLFSLTVATAAPVPIEMQGRIEKCSSGDGVTLALTLTNRSNRLIDISTGDLPWGLTSSVFLIVVTKTSTPEILKPIRHFDDPRVGSTTVKPSASAAGEIDLQRRFPDFLAKLKESDLLVVWSYQAELSDDTSTSKIVGSVLVERNSCGV